MKKSGLDHKNLLRAAEHLSKEKGHRWTEMREAVFACILDQEKPVTAYKIIESLSKEMGKDIKPASVYRSLEALSKLSLIVRIESLSAFIACQHPHEHHQHVFLVCYECGAADELTDHAVSKRLTAEAAHEGFRIDRQVLELQGACRTCQI